MKRLFDFTSAAAALLVLLPGLIVLSLLIREKLGRPILFRQLRPGRDGRIFQVLKFRTMTDARDSTGRLLPDAVRLTPFGRWLRSTSLDELPELINILKGEMSVVGPRPLLVEYLPLFTPEQARRHEVRPGLTGWAQINGRNAITWQEKFRLDVWYVEHRSFWLDLKIIFLTVARVFRRKDIAAAGEATMPRFTGSETPKSED